MSTPIHCPGAARIRPPPRIEACLHIPNNNPLFYSATQQLALLRTGVLSASELAELHITQIERLNPVLNALVDFDAERIRQHARSPRPGLLSGLPITIKSSIAVSGLRCEIGSPLNLDHRPETDAVAVQLLREQGALILGTTNCPEFLMAYESDNLLHGRTANPWSLSHSAGGSSGGEAAAIAAGMSAAGLGSDSGGSVRQPAHATGICALKPTPGRISAQGHLPPCVGPFAKLGAVGPMARRVEDLQLLFRILAEGSLPEPSNAPATVRNVSPEELRQVTVGYFEEDGLIPVTPETRQAVRMAVEALRHAGLRVEPFRPRFLEEARRLWDVFFIQCGALFYEPVLAGQHHRLSPVFSSFLETAASRTPLTAASLLQAWAAWDELCTVLVNEMRSHPLLVLPVCAVPAFRHGERTWKIEDGAVDYLDAMRFMQWFNVLGAPAAVVPIHHSPEGLPIGVQVAGRPFADEEVLAVAQMIDEAFGYLVPPLASGDTTPP